MVLRLTKPALRSARPRRGAMIAGDFPGVNAAVAPASRPPLAERLAKAAARKAMFDMDGFVEAVAILRELLSESPGYGPAHAMLAECYAYWGFRREIVYLECESYYRLARTHANAAVRIIPELGIAHRAMAIALRRGTGSDEIARKEEALTALDLDPNDAENWYEYWRAFGYSVSDPSLQRALELDPTLIGAHIDFGVVLCNEGRLQEAAASFRKALAVNPDHSLAVYNLAMTLYRLGNTDVAVSMLERALEKNSRSVLMAEGLNTIVGGGADVR